MTAILIDDEAPALAELAYILRAEGVEVIGTYTDPMEGLEAIRKRCPDVVFLDIAMPGMDGFSVANEVIAQDANISIVFATAYDHHAIQAFEINAVDYVLKPIDEIRIDKTLNRLNNDKGQISDTVKCDRKQKLEHMVKEKCKKTKKLPVWKSDRIYLIEPCHILFCKVESGQVFIVTDQQVYQVNESLSHLEEVLGDDFYRCHRSYLIHLDNVEEVIPWFNNTYVVKLRGCKDEIPISRRHLKEFKEYLGLI